MCDPFIRLEFRTRAKCLNTQPKTSYEQWIQIKFNVHELFAQTIVAKNLRSFRKYDALLRNNKSDWLNLMRDSWFVYICYFIYICLYHFLRRNLIHAFVCSYVHLFIRFFVDSNFCVELNCFGRDVSGHSQHEKCHYFIKQRRVCTRFIFVVISSDNNQVHFSIKITVWTIAINNRIINRCYVSKIINACTMFRLHAFKNRQLNDGKCTYLNTHKMDSTKMSLFTHKFPSSQLTTERSNCFELRKALRGMVNHWW